MAGGSEGIRMNIPISADASLVEIVERFLREEGIAASIDSSASGTCVRVAPPATRRECTVETIWAGGWISCSVARAAAGRMGISGRTMGGLLYALDVKIRQCELGCFR